MKVVTKCVAALLALGMSGRSRAGCSAGEDRRLVGQGLLPSEDAALFEAVKKFEAKTGVKVDLSQYAVQDGIPKTVAALDSRQPARRRVHRRLRLPGARQVGVRGQARGSHRRPDADQGQLPPQHRSRRRTSTTTRRRSARTTVSRSSSRRCTSSTGRTCSRRRVDTTIPDTWKEYWAFWCDKAQPDYRKKTGKRIFGTGFPMGVDSSDSYYSFLTFMDAYNVKLVDDNGKVTVSDPKVRAGHDRRRARLHDAVHEGMHAAVGDELEGSGQQRRVPQQDDDHDAQRDDLDRREVVRRHEQRQAQARGARAGEEELLREHRAPRDSRRSPTARR